MKLLKICLSIFMIGLLTSCASRYKNIKPEQMSAVPKSLTENGVLLEYKYEMLSRKYRRRARKQDIKIVSIKITNQSTKDIVFGNDVSLYYEKSDKPVEVIDRNLLYNSVKQRTAFYLFYLALSPVQLYTTSTSGNGQTSSESVFPIGLILGPGLAGGNMIVSATSNKKLKKNLAKYDPSGAVIKPGASVYGFVGIRSKTEEPLKLK